MLGNVSGYLSQEYGFPAECKIVAWSGDNPCSVAGLGLRNPGQYTASLHIRHHAHRDHVARAVVSCSTLTLLPDSLSAGDVGLSLGTSDTVFSIVDAAVSKPGTSPLNPPLITTTPRQTPTNVSMLAVSHL